MTDDERAEAEEREEVIGEGKSRRFPSRPPRIIQIQVLPFSLGSEPHQHGESVYALGDDGRLWWRVWLRDWNAWEEVTPPGYVTGIPYSHRPPPPRVHHLDRGLATCQRAGQGMRSNLTRLPGEWPEGQKWSLSWGDVTCDFCLVVRDYDGRAER